MAQSSQMLKRELGVFGATMMGLGSILGTGVFVSIGIASGIAGPSVIFAIGLVALVAICPMTGRTSERSRWLEGVK